jgi:P4 family phage/plasmid primase-like protien
MSISRLIPILSVQPSKPENKKLTKKQQLLAWEENERIEREKRIEKSLENGTGYRKPPEEGGGVCVLLEVLSPPIYDEEPIKIAKPTIQTKSENIVLSDNDRDKKYFENNLIEPTSLLRPNCKKFTENDLNILMEKKGEDSAFQGIDSFDPHWKYIIEALHLKIESGEKGYFEIANILLWAGSDLFRRSSDKTCWRWSKSKKLWEEKNFEDIKSVYLPALYSGILDCLKDYLKNFSSFLTNTKSFKHLLQFSQTKGIHKKSEALFLEAILDPTFDSSLNSSEYEIPTFGGMVVDLRTLKIRERTIKDLWSKEFPVRFNPNASTVYINNWLDSLFLLDDFEMKKKYQDVPKYLQYVLGYMLTGSVSEQKMFFMLGDGSAGKTTISNIIMYILGEEEGFYGSMPSSMIVEHQNSHHFSSSTPAPDPFYANLAGKRAVFSTENDTKSMMKMSKVKGMVGEDKLSFRKLRENRIQTLTPFYKLFHLCNELPYIPNKDYSDIRKFSLIYFPGVFKPENLIDKKDSRQRSINLNLTKNLRKQENLEGMLLHMCIGAQKYIQLREEGKNLETITPNILREIFEKQIDEMNRDKDENEDMIVDNWSLIERFFKDYIIKTDNDNDKIGSTELLNLFNKINGTTVNSKEFGTKMKQHITSGTKKLNINGQTLQGFVRVKYTVEEFYKSYILKTDKPNHNVKSNTLFKNFKEVYEDNKMNQIGFNEIMKKYINIIDDEYQNVIFNIINI